MSDSSGHVLRAACFHIATLQLVIDLLKGTSATPDRLTSICSLARYLFLCESMYL
jgi:hypothetical protein